MIALGYTRVSTIERTRPDLGPCESCGEKPAKPVTGLCAECENGLGVETVHVYISEEDHEWLVDDGSGWSHHPTASAALESVKAKDRARAEAGKSTVSVIEWTYKTASGRAIVRVLAGLA